MTRRGGWRRAPLEDDDAVVVKSTSELEREGITSLVKKPFRCLVGRSDHHHDDVDEFDAPHHVMMPPDDHHEESHYTHEYGFEATLQESKKKKKSRSFRKQKGGFSSTASLEEAPPPDELDAIHPNKSLVDPYAFPRRTQNSFESIPPDQLDAIMNSRSRSFADVIPPGKKNDPLDSESIRDVSKALREMERKLEAAGSQGKKVSRTKVMKALLTVVDQLDEEQSFVGAPLMNSETSAELHRSWTGNNTSTTDAKHAEAIALDRHRRNLEQMRELTITPNKERAESPWKGDKPSFSKMDGNQLFTESKSTEETEPEPEPEYISSSSEEEASQEEETEGIRRINKSKRGNKNKGSFANAVYDEEEEESTLEEGTLESEDTSYFAPPPRGKSRKGSFAHAVSPSAARSITQNGSFDMFNLDMKDPAIHDALADLLWIPSPNKSMDAGTPTTATSTKPNVVSPSSESNEANDGQQLDDMRNNESMLSYNGEDEYYDKPDIGEETTDSTTQSSHSSHQQEVQPKRPARETSWWKRRSRAALKPSSKDTPIVPPPEKYQPSSLRRGHPHHSIQTRVTVNTQQDGMDDLDPWQEEDHHHDW